MDQNLGNDPHSGREGEKPTKKKSKRKKPNGKSNGKTDWKGMAHQLSEEVNHLKGVNELLGKKSVEFAEEIEKLQEELEDSTRLVASMRAEVTELRRSAMGEREKVVLRNLRHFHGRVLNAQLENEKDKKKIQALCDEVSHFIREQL